MHSFGLYNSNKVSGLFFFITPMHNYHTRYVKHVFDPGLRFLTILGYWAPEGRDFLFKVPC